MEDTNLPPKSEINICLGENGKLFMLLIKEMFMEVSMTESRSNMSFFQELSFILFKLCIGVDT